jgi:hypothetical protein
MGKETIPNSGYWSNIAAMHNRMYTELYNTQGFYIPANSSDLNSTLSTITSACTVVITTQTFLTANLDLTTKPYVNFLFVGAGYIDGAYTITFNKNELIVEKTKIFSSPVTLAGHISNEYLRPEWWGAVRNGSTDDIIPINLCVQFAINQHILGGSCEVRLSSGVYYITSPVLLLSKNTSTYNYRTVHLVGEARSYDYGSRILVSYKDKPAVISQAILGLQIRNVHIVGLGVQNMAYGNLLREDYLDSTLRRHKYSPYSGIAIDPFSGSTDPTTMYPGLESYYVGAQGSSNTVIEKCKINNFVGAIALSISQHTQLDDSVIIRDCNADYNQVALIIGQDQCVGVYLENLHASFLECVVDTQRWGNASASFIHVLGGVVTNCRWLFLLSNRRGLSSVTNFYCESTWSIGYVQNTTSFKVSPTAFNNCTLRLVDPYKMALQSIGCQLFVEDTQVIFNNCFIGYYVGQSDPLQMGGSGKLTLNNCCLDGIIASGVSELRIKYNNCNFYYPQNASLSWLGIKGYSYEDINYEIDDAKADTLPAFKQLYYEILSGITIVNNNDGTGYIANNSFIQVGDILIIPGSRKKYDYTVIEGGHNISCVVVTSYDSDNSRFIVSGIPVDSTYTTYSSVYILLADPIRTNNILFDINSGTSQLFNIKNVNNLYVGMTYYQSGTNYRITTVDKNAATATFDQNFPLTRTDLTFVQLPTMRNYFQFSASSVPTTGVYAVGDYVVNSNPTLVGGQIIKGWICSVSGEPGTFIIDYY